LRRWFSARNSLDFSIGAVSTLSWASKNANGKVVTPEPDPGSEASTTESPRVANRWILPRTWLASLSVGYTHTLADVVTFHVALALSERPAYNGNFTGDNPLTQRGALKLGIGSVQLIALRRQPLVRIHVRDWFALNVDAALTVDFGASRFEEVYLAGASFVW
jgi:hypothetical protein